MGPGLGLEDRGAWTVRGGGCCPTAGLRTGRWVSLEAPCPHWEAKSPLPRNARGPCPHTLAGGRSSDAWQDGDFPHSDHRALATPRAPAPRQQGGDPGHVPQAVVRSLAPASVVPGEAKGCLDLGLPGLDEPLGLAGPVAMIWGYRCGSPCHSPVGVGSLSALLSHLDHAFPVLSGGHAGRGSTPRPPTLRLWTVLHLGLRWHLHRPVRCQRTPAGATG